MSIAVRKAPRLLDQNQRRRRPTALLRYDNKLTSGSVRALRVAGAGAGSGAVGDDGTELDAGLVQSICRSWPNLATEVKSRVVRPGLARSWLRWPADLVCQKMTPLRGMTLLRKKCRYKGIDDSEGEDNQQCCISHNVYYVK